ncbi:MAG: hypothetical protein Q9217_004952 [Psora testacea]
MAEVSNFNPLLALAEEISGQVNTLDKYMKEESILNPSLAAGASTELWSSHSAHIEAARTSIFGSTKQLNRLLNGPHGFLHEFISSNWELGALYTVLEFNILEKIPLDGQVHVSQLALKSNLPENKLLSILRLISCEQILEEVSEKVFRHTAISEELVNDPNLKAFIGFQKPTIIGLDNLLSNMPGEIRSTTGTRNIPRSQRVSARQWKGSNNVSPETEVVFEYACNILITPLVKALDPGNMMFYEWFSSNQKSGRNLVVEVGAMNGQVSAFLADKFPEMSFEVQVPSQDLVTKAQQALSPALQQRISFYHRDKFTMQPLDNSNDILAYLICNIFWNCSDEDCVKILQSFIAALEKSPEAVILVNEMISPAKGIFEPHVEEAYRRRDVTTMTMHNAKQRSEEEWRALFAQACPHFKVFHTQMILISPIELY